MYDQKIASSSLENNIVEMIAHELAHQYFGNIVGPKWWSFTWLNEGFATLYEFYIPSFVFHDDNHMERFETTILSSAFEADSYPDAKPLSFYVETPIEIRNKFDFISYRKGGAVLRMFQEALTVPTFTKGLTFYLNEMYFESATPKDLHRNLQKAYDEDFPQSGVDIDAVMTTWEEQAGYPIIKVRKHGDFFVFEQKRFGGGKEIYSIPISYVLKSEVKLSDKTSMFWFNTATAQLESKDDWIILDFMNTGYYKITYDKQIFKAIVKDLPRSSKKISPAKRKQLFKDTRERLVEDNIEAFCGLEHLSYLKQEANHAVWSEGLELETLLSEHLFGTPATTKYQSFIKDIVDPHLNRLGYDKIKGEPLSDSELRKIVTRLSCKALDEECLNYELRRLVKFVDTGKGFYNLCEGLRKANETVHSKLIQTALKLEDSSEKYNYISNLGCSLDPHLPKNYLQVLLDKSNNLNNYDRLEGISSTMTKSVIGLEVVLDFVQENLHEIESM